MLPLHHRRLAVPLAVLALLLLLHPATADSLSPNEQKVVDLVNQQRAAAGLPPVRVDWRLVNAARAHNQLMAEKQTPSHELPGEPPVCHGDDRYRAHGYDWTFCGENVAAGQTSPEQVMSDWMASDGHRANILNPKARDIGIAFTTGGNYGTWWTQDFGAPSGSSAPAAPPPSQAPVASGVPTAASELLNEAERRQVIEFNPGAALQKRIFSDGFVPNSGEFRLGVGGVEYAAQRAEHLGSGRVRVYYVRVGDWSAVGAVERGGGDSLAQALLAAGEQRQVIQFNPGAALQKRIFGDGFVPNSGEFRLSVGGVEFAGQRAEHLGSGRVRVYYVRVGDWSAVQNATR